MEYEDLTLSHTPVPLSSEYSDRIICIRTVFSVTFLGLCKCHWHMSYTIYSDYFPFLYLFLFGVNNDHFLISWVFYILIPTLSPVYINLLSSFLYALGFFLSLVPSPCLFLSFLLPFPSFPFKRNLTKGLLTCLLPKRLVDLWTSCTSSHLKISFHHHAGNSLIFLLCWNPMFYYFLVNYCFSRMYLSVATWKVNAFET